MPNGVRRAANSAEQNTKGVTTGKTERHCAHTQNNITTSTVNNVSNKKNDTTTSTVNNGFCGLSFGVWHTRTTKSNGVQPTPINLKQTARETLNAVGTGGKSNAKKQNSARNCKPLPQNVKPNSNGNRNIIGIHLQCSTASAFRFRHA